MSTLRSLVSLVAGLASVCTLLAGTACCCIPSEEDRARTAAEREAREAEEAKLKAVARERARGLAESYNTISEVIDIEAPFDSKTCPDEVIKAARAADDTLFRVELWTIDACAMPGFTGCEAWAWLEHDDIASLKAVAANPTGEFEDQVLETVGEPTHRFLGVYLATVSGVEPSGFEKGGWLKDGSFVGGVFEGGMVVVDLQERAELCRVPIYAENSDEITYDDGGAFKDDPGKVILEDFQKNLEKATNKALEERGEQLKVNFIGVF